MFFDHYADWILYFDVNGKFNLLKSINGKYDDSN